MDFAIIDKAERKAARKKKEIERQNKKLEQSTQS